jgi:hypothetical protein
MKTESTEAKGRVKTAAKIHIGHNIGGQLLKACKGAVFQS